MVTVVAAKPTISAAAHAAILRKVAVTAVTDARAAQEQARASSTEQLVRAAFRACVFAERALRKAAAVADEESARMLAEAKRFSAAADDLKAQLVRIIEG